MSIQQEMNIVELESQVRSLTMALTQLQNAVRSAVLELEDDCYNEAKMILSDVLPEDYDETI